MKKSFVPGLLVLSIGLVGCGGGEAVDATGSAPAPVVKKLDFKPSASAGVPVGIDAQVDVKKLMAMNAQPGRRDPFALLPAEIEFEKSQRSAYFVDTTGGFSFRYTPPPEVDDRPVVEPQPFRRLAGIIIGDAISALIDMGDGQGFQIVRPGSKLGEWTVVSIDEEKAVLTRAGNKLPKAVEVFLAEPQAGAGGGGGGNQGGGAAGGGQGQGGSGDIPGGGRGRGGRGGGRPGDDL
ncbi:MAG TPA: hypothetical protein PKA27_03600 [Fimbriimonadaceae bacterium]|nr:hypothetical protein [Fimbriimonadaceae bacterium]